MGNQNKGYVSVADSSTVFGRALPVGQRILQEDINVEFILTQEASSGDTLDTVTKDVFFSGINTGGLLTGGVITINAGDNTKFDVSAGTGIAADYTDPLNPFLKFVKWNAFIGESLPNILLDFTVVSIDKDGNLVKLSGAFEPESAKRTNIILQVITHASQTQIDDIDNFTGPAFDYVKGLGDYIDNAPPLNIGNNHTTAGANLNLNKDAGRTIRNFINYRIDPANPSEILDIAQTPIFPLYSFQNGIGGFNIVPSAGSVDPANYDDGSGTLATVAMNDFSTQLICYTSQAAITIITYGQTTYNSLQDALDDVPYQLLAINPLLIISVCTNILIVRNNAINLEDPAQAKLSVNRFKFF